MATRRRSPPSRPTRAPLPRRSSAAWTVVRILLGVGAGYYVAAYLVVSLLRLPYPFDLEWMEGAVLEHVKRVLAGQPIYAAPTLQFVPLDYTPFYYYAAAGAAGLMGPGPMAARLVSWLATLGSFGLLFVLVRHETRSRAPGWIAVGLFAATYRLGGAWFDVARGDSLALCFLLAGVCALRLDRSPFRSPLLAGLLIALAVMTKQSTALAVVPLVLWLVLVERGRGLTLAASLGIAVAVAVLALERTSDGWFQFYVLRVALGHHPDWSLLRRFPLSDLGWRFAIALGLMSWAVARPATRPAKDTLGFYAALLVGLLLSAWHLRLFTGSYDNVLMPAHLGLALVTAIAWSQIGPGRASARASTVASVLMLVLLATLWWNPLAQVPTAADRAANQQVVAGLQSVPGRAIVSSHGAMAALAGKPSHAHVVPFMDVVKGTRGPVETALLRTLRDTLAAHAYPMLVMDTRDWLLDEALLAGYLVRGRIFADDAVAWTVTGMRTRPEYLLTPRVPADSLP